jgi:two-component system OmpR family response regulator
MAQTILIVEDDPKTAQLLGYNLQKAGFQCSVLADGSAVLSRIRKSLPDLLLLDIMLPGMDGLEICKHIKRDPKLQSLPVIMLTAKGEEVDRIVGFELGADDYVLKPFSPRELILRIKAVLNRRAVVNHAIQPDAILQAGLLKIDLSRHCVTVKNTPVELTAMEFKLLATLLERRGRVQTREQLLGDVWDISADVLTRTVDTHVTHLRQKLGKAGDLIETIRGVGYRFSES